jgi:DSS1/SEM1 family
VTICTIIILLSALKTKQEVGRASHILIKKNMSQEQDKNDATSSSTTTQNATNAAAASTATTSTTTQLITPKAIMDALEEDDEFEEFDHEQWSKSDTTAAAQSGIPTHQHQWMDNWDDDMDDDFTKNLRAALTKD